jgi:SP family sugar:H+ symporter-like MFS transporter
MYRSEVKPWQSSNWKPHLSEEAHQRVAEKEGRTIAGEREKASVSESS